MTVEQAVTFMTVDNYNAQKAVYNRTIQATVAAAMDGVSPDRVTNIVVGTASASTAQRQLRGATHLAAIPPCFLSYTVRVFDPTVTFDSLRAQLTESAASGKMASDLQYFAALYNATNISNGTFAEPSVTDISSDDFSSDRMTGGAIACIVIGVCMFLALIVVAVMFFCGCHNKQDRSAVYVVSMDEFDLYNGLETVPVQTTITQSDFDENNRVGVVPVQDNPAKEAAAADQYKGMETAPEANSPTVFMFDQYNEQKTVPVGGNPSSEVSEV